MPLGAGRLKISLFAVFLPDDVSPPPTGSPQDVPLRQAQGTSCGEAQKADR
ncbi:Uncharacterized protein dnm_092800 [Desulfonema magnum]|uniref:Uncharacterized protein n=1 Tax=Desulfonema magnum TaxID=45655 RepID=A0A975BX70_9BACT|nr:Uncharacterized protein dnm_092800 [Desulfonema magnum]